MKALAEDLDVWSRLTGCDAADTVQWTRRIEGQLSLLLPVPVQPGRPHVRSRRLKYHAARNIGRKRKEPMA